MVKKMVQGPRIIRDISWLSFNERVLQEAQDSSVPLSSRLRFLGIFSNNLDEFFRVRVATLTRMLKLGKEAMVGFDKKPDQILKEIQMIVRSQQKDFEATYETILAEMKRKKIVMLNDRQLNKEQKKFVEAYFDEKVRTNISPLMIESIPELPLLHDKSIYLACTLSNEHNSFMNSYTLIEVPTQVLPRFVILPSNKGVKSLILLEDIIRVCLPKLFTQFGFTIFEGFIFKVTRDAELDIDNDIQFTLIQRLQKGLKERKKGKAVRFVYDKAMPKNLLDYLVKLLSLSRRDQLVPGGRIHNFKDFINFPNKVFEEHAFRPAPFIHPLFVQPIRILDVLKQRDVMLHFPYHSFDSVIDLLREAAIDPFVESIKITCYRLAKESKIINALINAVRNGKKVVVVIELRARFDEEANLRWKQILEDEGVEVFTGFPDMKVHAKICLISKRIHKSLHYYGFVSTGNLNESTSKIYGDHCLLTADKRITTDIRHVFAYLMKTKQLNSLKLCKHLLVSPLNT
nr:polyphosphate kinase 1 [Chitinophagaceae bacterium]